MLSKVYTGTLHGVEGLTVLVETDILQGLPNLNLVGLAGAEIREAKERVHSAVVNSGYSFPAKRITINLSPANRKKEGSHFDLPMAVGMLTSMGVIEPSNLEGTAFIGELSLDGNINPVRGVLPMVMGLHQNGIKKIVVPEKNAEEAALVNTVEIYVFSTLKQIVNWLGSECEARPYKRKGKTLKSKSPEDFKSVSGQENAKRAITIAVAGRHDIIMIGFPGTGKTMMSRLIPTIMPEMSIEEKLEVTKIYSIAGELSEEIPLIENRPFRSPHHTISSAGLMGGGSKPRPGEFSLAHSGVLFLDEFPEFGNHILEMLRQPLEEGKITICRAQGSFCFPGEIMLVAAGNPCRCGYSGDERHQCTCSQGQLSAYRSKFSGPILDRVDMHIEIPPVKYEELTGSEKENISSAEMIGHVERARALQKERYQEEKISWYASLNTELMKKYCQLNKESQRLMKQAFTTFAMSPRAYTKVVKVARTIADMEMSHQIEEQHLAEALRYRAFEKFYMGGKL